jgi:hypothetical protein
MPSPQVFAAHVVQVLGASAMPASDTSKPLPASIPLDVSTICVQLGSHGLVAHGPAVPRL